MALVLFPPSPHSSPGNGDVRAGWALPHEFGALIADLRANTPGIENVVISTHCQNDLGLSTANSLAGAQAGARQARAPAPSRAPRGTPHSWRQGLCTNMQRIRRSSQPAA